MDIWDNVSLTSINGLSSLQTVGDEFTVSENPNLSECAPLNGCQMMKNLTLRSFYDKIRLTRLTTSRTLRTPSSLMSPRIPSLI